MSSLKQSTTLYESELYIDSNSPDPMDTLAPIVNKKDFPKGRVADTSENRANAALACCAQLMRQLRVLKFRVRELESQSGHSG
jgi:hypothetical protein